MAEREIQLDRWDTLGFFTDYFSGESPAASAASVQTPVEKTDIPKEIRVGATSHIWRLAKENILEGGTPKVSSKTVRIR